MPADARADSAAAVAVARALGWLSDTLSAGADLRTDSRAVRPGDGFLAYAVDGADNRPHVGDAIARGAAAVLFQPRGASPHAGFGDTPVLPVPGLDALAGPIASAWYGEPSRQMTVIGVTGTNGKTSLTQWIALALATLGVRTATIGTLGVGLPDKLVPTGFTTPNAAQLQQSLAALRRDGAAAVAMEVSSHALHQGRVNGTAFDIAVFTNLSQDHLDYHGTMAAYEAAKARLFDWPGLRFAVVNRDDPAGARLLRQLDGQLPTLSYGIGAVPDSTTPGTVPATCHLHATDIRVTPAGGTALTVHAAANGSAAPAAVAIEVATLGEFNVSNLLGVLGALLATQWLRAHPQADAATDLLEPMAWRAALGALARLQPVVGRMQRLGGRPQHDEPLVVIDYAHTPDALEKTLLALRPVAQARGGELNVVFGCGGDRDAGKRPLMGAVAARLAHAVVLTSDNPRSEVPAAIIDQIAAGAANAPGVVTPGVGTPGVAGHVVERVRRIEDRASAILQAIRAARCEDVVLLAGKGHEATQEIMGKKRPFSDQDHAQLALAARATHREHE
ncbi:UDP-N-acetylmuramoyl-L-alanyl-D-glutamate--2,6-diaminopimelate ligase [Robbsia sp. Bb-Pol-6]|uniref:UDP-N-acetylmuramoyl-L-alanyl-D-glutamate--2,6-diaminopimelate ligase n=1 Tax=Robbsia betulipollinis TaxID=2981849 RepID=A0ABT3ZQX4_9BURK|nr:UDP-N-acetylmuramoyl-L-alanyl-D-glutamate--2,6-diaminopimelate ligase [Robbsia betulipollinis]MCY0388951.1 UDP-N-acetylmuramoyl-L-alanyl-D-glutamate--2,6-diaminopimelate ligase [Robbsia betulipollinis]